MTSPDVWHRLDGRMLVVAPLQHVVRLLPLLLVLLFTGRGDPVRLWITVGIAGLLIVMGVIRWRTTRYRITPERVELHSGWLNRQRRSVPRDRLRTVDATSSLLHRAFGLSVLHVHAASGSSTEHHGLKLDAVTTAEADRLRRLLLAPVAAPAAVGGPATGSEPEPAAEELSRLRWSWVRFAPLTVSSLLGTGVILAAVWNVFGELGLEPGDVPIIDRTAEEIFDAAVWVTVGMLGAILLVLAVAGAVLIFTERWWGYRLTRGDDDTLRVHRGLLTKRSLSVAGSRLRGVALGETLLLRAGGGAQVRALATGLGRGDQGGALQPPVPRAQAHRLAAVVLNEPPERATLAPLRAHPPRARSRRLTRALVPAVALSGAAWLVAAFAPGWAWLGPLSLALPVLAVPLAFDRYRSLGHLLTDRHLVSRLGSLHRRTVALDRTGVIGWTFRQSVFQRRAGLVTVEAVTAAGRGGYPVLDVAPGEAVAVAEAITPGALAGLRGSAPAGAEQPAGDLAAQRAGGRPQERLHHR